MTASIRIRMYNVGFGDCFLLTFPSPDRPHKVLIDCGKHTLSKTDPKLSRIVQRVLNDIQEPGGPRVDVVVATHRHWDHVEGFSAEEWQQVTVGEVWMPWTEHPTDPLARDICDRQSRKATHLQRGISALALDGSEKEYLLGYAGNNLTNAAAMNLLHRGFLGNALRRFLPEPDESKNNFRTDWLPGVEVYVLGPPRDPKVMQEMEPPEKESFLRAWDSNSRTLSDRPSPFGSKWFLSRAEYEQRARLELDQDLSLASEQHIGQVFDDATFELLARLEQAVNSTSLVLLFHAGNAWLLFSGDAQWGTWNFILNNPRYTKLLENLTFYKVGHHGSDNATPISFVERYCNGRTIAMLPYGTVQKWPDIPRARLLNRLLEKNVALARSDQAPPPSGPFNPYSENGGVLFIDTEVEM